MRQLRQGFYCMNLESKKDGNNRKTEQVVLKLTLFCF